MLPRPHRLTHQDDYARLRRIGRSRAHPLLILVTATNGAKGIRIGFTVGKRAGSAVVRNRVKRRLREAIRPYMTHIHQGNDIVFIARNESADAGLREICEAVGDLLRRSNLLKERES